jgi:quercetin dioxygenase-like cupin family protein
MICANTGAVAGVQVVKPGSGRPVWASHTSDIHFTFVLHGQLTLQSKEQTAQRLLAGDAFVIPPDMACLYSAPSEDLELLEVSLPGEFDTHLEDGA